MQTFAPTKLPPMLLVKSLLYPSVLGLPHDATAQASKKEPHPHNSQAVPWILKRDPRGSLDMPLIVPISCAGGPQPPERAPVRFELPTPRSASVPNC